jgi:hypothetical protein
MYKIKVARVQLSNLISSLSRNAPLCITLPHILCSHLISSLDNLMMAYNRAETCSCILYIATNCNAPGSSVGIATDYGLDGPG